MLKILYISPENTVGTLNLWKSYHESRGNICRTVTFYPSSAGYPEDICLHLPLISTGKGYRSFRHRLQKRWYGQDPQTAKAGKPPVWTPSGTAEALWFRVRDFIWSFSVEQAIERYHLDEFDIYHFEWGLDFYRDCRFAARMKEAGKTIINTYHGQDMRNRGVLPVMDELADLRLSSELDLLDLHPKLKYLFLPFRTAAFSHPDKAVHKPLKVCHATTNRYFKGSDHIIRVCRELEADGLIEFVLIENRPHEEALELKSGCDVNIDQLTDLGGWGYGMNSVESLSMGICTLAFLNPTYEKFIPDHPFVNTHPETLRDNLLQLIKDPDSVAERGRSGREWVRTHHDISAVGKQLYAYYEDLRGDGRLVS